MRALSLRRLLPGFHLPGFLRPDFGQRPWLKFIRKRSGPFSGRVSLSRDRVYIVPTRAGLVFSLLLLVLLLGSINYEKSLGFALTFLLTGIGNVCLLTTWRNLAGLQVSAEKSHPVFAGETARFSLQLGNPKSLHRLAIALSYEDVEQDLVDVAPNARQLIHFNVPARRRGRLRAGRFRLYTEFPSGLFVASTWLDMSLECLVYPAPDRRTLPPSGRHDESGDDEHGGSGLEHFSHLAKYQQGDRISRISWKAAARTGELFIKSFTGAAPQTTWINWEEIPARDSEQRLSIMAAMVINADSHQQPYGLVLPGKTIEPDLGRSHYHRCMRELALF